MVKKIPDDKEIAAWQSFIKDISPLKNQKQSTFFTKGPHVNRERIHLQRRQEYYDHQQQISSVKLSNTEVNSKKIRMTKVKIEACLDLHGLTKDQAQNRLRSFFINAQMQHKIWVLVITGKGNPGSETTLRSLVPGWLDNLACVSAYALAKSTDGGMGALYVRLKKLSG